MEGFEWMSRGAWALMGRKPVGNEYMGGCIGDRKKEGNGVLSSTSKRDFEGGSDGGPRSPFKEEITKGDQIKL